MTANTHTITFPGVDLTGTLDHDDDQRSLTLWSEDGPECLSINLAMYGYIAPPGHIHIKDWSEHDGVAASMQSQGLVEIVETVCVGPFRLRAHLVRVSI